MVLVGEIGDDDRRLVSHYICVGRRQRCGGGEKLLIAAQTLPCHGSAIERDHGCIFSWVSPIRTRSRVNAISHGHPPTHFITGMSAEADCCPFQSPDQQREMKTTSDSNRYSC